MRSFDRLSVIIGLLVAIPALSNYVVASENKTRIAIVSSYHKDYLWSQDTNKGVVAGLLQFGFLDNAAQGAEYSLNNSVESEKTVLLKLWMDTKRKSSQNEMEQSVANTVNRLREFRPDLIMLGDDNATNYIGNLYVDTDIPVVFWGVNGNPLKYDLIDSKEHPGHNVTGVYQAGYLLEGIQWLKKLLPEIKRIAVLSDDSPTGRTKAKELARFARTGRLPVEIVETVVTNSLAHWKSRALALQEKVDAFFVLNHNTLRDQHDKPVDQLMIGAWYLKNIKIPDISHERQFVVEGMLCAVDDSGFKQGFEAVQIANRILRGQEDPASIQVYAPERGRFVVNLERAKMLGILDRVIGNPMVEEQVVEALALKRFPKP